jgi:hypothetical protein
VVSYHYGRIEGEPSLPMTRFDVAGVGEAGKSKGPRGVMGHVERVANSLKRSETFTPDLIRALNETLNTMR